MEKGKIDDSPNKIKTLKEETAKKMQKDLDKEISLRLEELDNLKKLRIAELEKSFEQEKSLIRDYAKRISEILSRNLDKYSSDYDHVFLSEINTLAIKNSLVKGTRDSDSILSKSSVSSSQGINNVHKEQVEDLIINYAVKKNIKDRDIKIEKDGEEIEVSFFDAVVESIVSGNRIDSAVNSALNEKEKKFRDNFRNYVRTKITVPINNLI